jgi:hypothetical protein
MAFAACIQNVKYFAPIASSRLYEHRKMFQQINKRTQSAKNIERTYSLVNETSYTKTAATAAATAATVTIAALEKQSKKEEWQQQTWQQYPQKQQELQ